VCDAITKNGTRCKRDGFCWQHPRSGASQKAQTPELAPPRIGRHVRSAWFGFGGNLQGFVGSLTVSLIANLVFFGLQLQIPPRIEVVNSVLEAGPTTVASNRDASCPADRPAKSTFTATSPDSGLSAPAVYSGSVQDVVRTSADFPAASLGNNVNDLAKNELPQGLSDLKGSVFSEGRLSGANTLQLPNLASANSDTTLNPNIISGANLMTVPTGGVFDPSKAISSPPLDQIKTLMEASGIGSLQTGIAQSTNFQMPSYVGTLTDNPTPSGIQPASLTINGSGTPTVLPTTWQTFPANSSPTFPVTAPNALQPNSQ
jgi:hypothetical protein